MIKKLIISFVFLITTLSIQSLAQVLSLDMESVLDLFSMQSTEGENAILDYRNQLLTDENTRKEYLPTLSFSLNPLSFNRSLRVLQNPADGSYSYVTDFSNNSSAGLSLSQKIPLTNGTFSVSSSVNMLAELSRNRNSFSTTPYSFGYQQRLLGEYKLYKWKRQIEQLKRGKLSKDFVNKIAQIQNKALSMFLDCCMKQLSMEYAIEQTRMSDSLLTISRIRYEQGLILEKDYLSLELQNTNEHLSQEETKRNYNNALDDFLQYINQKTDKSLVRLRFPMEEIPLLIDYDEAYILMNEFHAQKEDFQIRRKEAEQNMYSTRTQQWINANVNLSYGSNHYGATFSEAYRNPSSQQAVMLSLQIPLFDWGAGRNKVIIAKNNYQQNINNINKEEENLNIALRKEVERYNSLLQTLALSKRSYELSQRSYRLALLQLDQQSISIDKLIEMQNTMRSNHTRYLSNLNNTWTQLFKLRTQCQYDFRVRKPLIELLNSYVTK